MTDQEIVAASERLLRPYRIREDCPYLSEDQRELSRLDLEGRSAWMGEWLMLAASNVLLAPQQCLPGRRPLGASGQAGIR